MVRNGQRTAFTGALLGLVLVALAASGACAARVGPDGQPLTVDQRISEDVRRILADEDGLVSDDITVETRDGVVILSGVQEEAGPLREALQRIARVNGVVEVINRVRIIRGAVRPTGS